MRNPWDRALIENRSVRYKYRMEIYLRSRQNNELLDLKARNPDFESPEKKQKYFLWT